jgi:hypothetical protein
MKRFDTLIENARNDGAMQQCCKKLEAAGRSATWYSMDRQRINAGTFDGLREEIDAAEALWRASQILKTAEHDS